MLNFALQNVKKRSASVGFAHLNLTSISEIKWSPCIWSAFKLALPRLPKNLLCTGYLYDCPGYALVTKSVWHRHCPHTHVYFSTSPSAYVCLTLTPPSIL